VPNVVYSCGSLVHRGQLIIPYAMSDYGTTFATLPLCDVLAAMDSPLHLAFPFSRVGARSGVLRSKNDVLSARTAKATAEITPGKFLGHTQLGLTFRARHDRKQANLNRGTSGGLQPRADSRFAVWGDVWAAGVVWARCPL